MIINTDSNNYHLIPTQYDDTILYLYSILTKLNKSIPLYVIIETAFHNSLGNYIVCPIIHTTMRRKIDIEFLHYQNNAYVNSSSLIVNLYLNKFNINILLFKFDTMFSNMFTEYDIEKLNSIFSDLYIFINRVLNLFIINKVKKLALMHTQVYSYSTNRGYNNTTKLLNIYIGKVALQLIISYLEYIGLLIISDLNITMLFPYGIGKRLNFDISIDRIHIDIKAGINQMSKFNNYYNYIMYLLLHIDCNVTLLDIQTLCLEYKLFNDNVLRR